jgi:HK97 family phage major capsid protein
VADRKTAAQIANEREDLAKRANEAHEKGDIEACDTLLAERDALGDPLEEATTREAALKAALEATEVDKSHRDPTDALTDTKSVDEAKEGVMIYKHGAMGDSIGNFEVVPYARKDSEGYRKDMPAACQLPSIVRRLPKKLAEEAEAYRTAFAQYARKGLSALDVDGRKALQEGTDTEGGYFVPSDFMLPTIIAQGVPGGVTRPLASQFQTSRDAGTFPTSTDDVTWAVVAEEGAFGESVPTIGQVAFTVRKLGRIEKVSDELLEDSAVDVPSLLNILLRSSLGRYEDEQAVAGDGTTEPQGIRVGATTDVTDLITLAAPTALEIIKGYFELPAQWRAGATWHTTSSFMAQVAGIGAAAAGVHAIQDLTKAPDERLLGKPVTMWDGTGWDDAATIGANEELGCLGNFRAGYYFIDRTGMSVQRLDELYSANDQVGFKARVRYDSRVAVAAAFITLKAAAS